MRTLLFILLTMTIGQAAYSQNTLAKIKFEDAEKAYNEAKYSECIKLLDETEKILGQSAPNILYLRILASQKILEANPNENFVIISTLRGYCSDYLTNYDIQGLEDKYREVYEISYY